MKTVRNLSMIAVLFLLAAASATAQNDNLDFKLENRTGVNVYAVFLAPHDSDDWGEDVMSSDILRDGEDVDIEFHPKAKAKIWDLRIEDKEGNSIEWENLDLTEISTLTLRLKKNKPVAEWR